MASPDIDTQKTDEQTPLPSESNPLENITESLEKITLQHEDSSVDVVVKTDEPPRPPYVYSRAEILYLSKSPLVKAPDGMPPLKYWFGDWTEQQVSSKKDSESNGASASPRDRRFRRDPEDSDAPSRPTFRSTLSQPSQMGNFRHQSIRTADRDKDKDLDRERERDIRDKEGQERLRSLSDKYDRDRLALSSAATALRNKDRESAPHLGSGRETSKRKVGESNDDWRRGADPSRGNRDDRLDNARRDRDNRDRPRSRSRPRRDPSASRRDRERDDRDRDWGRRDDHYRRDADHYGRDRDRYEYNRSRDNDREGDDDPRRWRDDGRRDERMAARRDRERGWDRWEPSHERERVDERDARGKRVNGRDRRGGTGEDGKEKEDRRDREREKEKEPAWMDDYVPSATSGGILGGKGGQGELDGIQAWKKGMKEREQKDKDHSSSETHEEPSTELGEVQATGKSESQLDEIQLFKLMMKREADKKVNSPPTNTLTNIEVSSSSTVTTIEPTRKEGSSGLPSVAESTPASQLPVAPSGSSPAQTSNGSRSLLNIITSTSQETSVTSQPVRASSLASELSTPTSRMFPNGPASKVSPSDAISRPAGDILLSGTAAAGTSSPHPFNPPPGSRLLAFGSRAPSAASTSSGIASAKSLGTMETVQTVHATNTTQVANKQANALPISGITTTASSLGDSYMIATETQFVPNARTTPTERGLRSFSPFSQAPQSVAYEEIQEVHVGQSDHIRRSSVATSVDRSPFSVTSEGSSPYSDLAGGSSSYNGGSLDASITGNNYASGKGSRFAKFFDAKSREPQPINVPLRKGPNVPGYISTSPHPGQRPDSMSMNGSLSSVNENRTMEDIFAMLQSSSQQGHRGSPQIGQTARMQSGNGAFGPSVAELHALQLHQLQQQQLLQSNRLDSIYDTRLDDRNFVPDGMVPGLRPATRPRSREPSAAMLYTEQIDDPVHFNVQRIPQQRNLEQMYQGGPPMYNQPNIGRNTVMHAPQSQFRGGPSPIASQNPLQVPQRLPPGLANLGGRPPHDPSQYLGNPLGVQGGGLNTIHPNAPAPQGFSNYGGGGVGFGNPQARGPIPSHQQNAIAMNQVGLGPSPNMDLRGASQAQLLALGAGNISAGPRGGNVGFNPHHGSASQVHLSQLALRQQQQQQQQQQQHLPPHMLPHLLQPHLQQQHNIPTNNSQGAQDLMALLMGGHRGD
ncbi:hypothetical protein C8Q75DRAFT_750127 [Abortiporus biennis]|nr:hypothetical protein C8Q75DRAFT_750127 [Abortiporus biennis]